MVVMLSPSQLFRKSGGTRESRVPNLTHEIQGDPDGRDKV